MKSEMHWPLGAVLLVVLSVATGLFSGNAWIVPWSLSLVLFGLPHGAIDHDVCLKLWMPQPPPRWTLAGILCAYLALSLLVLAAWFLAPGLLFIGFLVLTILHWGLADLWWSWKRDPTVFRSRGHRAVFALFRGTIPILLPLALDPVIFRHTAEVTCRLFSSTVHFAWIEWPETRLVAGGIILVSGLLDTVISRGNRWLNLFESLSLIVFFCALPTVAAVGLYFAFWHGFRHILRLLDFEDSSWKRFAVRSLPGTLGAVVLLVFLFTRVRPIFGNQELLGIYLAVIAALTVPHALVVGWLDLREGLWRHDYPATLPTHEA